jgi:hypothetical protein
VRRRRWRRCVQRERDGCPAFDACAEPEPVTDPGAHAVADPDAYAVTDAHAVSHTGAYAGAYADPGSYADPGAYAVTDAGESRADDLRHTACPRHVGPGLQLPAGRRRC